MTNQLLTTIDARGFWHAVGQRATGSTVLTACAARVPAGFLALSATHICADPPTMMASIDKRTSALTTILEAKHFAINYLSKSSASLADIFGGKSELKGAARFGTESWTTLVTGAPVLEKAVGAIDCELVETIERYGTILVLGRVVAAQYDSDEVPLIHFRGRYIQ